MYFSQYALTLNRTFMLLAITGVFSVSAQAPWSEQQIEVVNLYHSAQLPQARALAVQAVTQAMMGTDDMAKVVAWNNLAALDEADGHYAKAKEGYAQALHLVTASFGREHLATATVLNNLGSLYREQQDYDQALAFYREGLEIRQRLGGEKSLEVAESLNNLGSIYKVKQDYEQGRQVYIRAFEIQRELLGGNAEELAITGNNLATLLHRQGNLADAERFYVGALNQLSQLGKGKSLEFAKIAFNYAQILKKQGSLDQANDHLLFVLPIFDRHLGVSSMLAIKTLEQLSDIASQQQNSKKAIEFYQKSQERQAGNKGGVL